MAGKIRGITIELSADASGVLDAVSDINKQLKTTSKDLKDVDKLLKLDPSNTTLLTQKSKLLQEQIGNCKDKLEALKKAQEDMDANGVDKNSQQYQALQREIIATEQELKKLEQTAGSGSAALAKISVATGEIGEKMENAGKKLSVLSAGIAAIGVAAVKSFEEVDEGADIVIKKTGATGEAAEEMEDAYKHVAQGIVADFTDIGTVVGETATRFDLTGSELENLSKTFLEFADINDVDVQTAVEGVDKALKTFNVDQDQAENVMGLLTKTSQETGISMTELLGTLQSAGPAFKEMGLDIDDAVTLMGSFEEAGLDSSDMLSKLQKAATYYNEKGLDMSEGLKSLIERLQDSSTEAEATAEAYEIFGKKGGLAFITAAQEGKISLDDLSSSLDEYSTVVDDTYQQTLDGTDAMKLAWQNMKIGLSELGEVIGNTLAPIMEKITGVIQSVVEWFDNLDEGTKELVVTIAAIVAAIGPLLIVGGKVMSGISSITKALSSIGTISMGPIGIAITAIAALTAAGVALFDSWKTAYQDASPFTEALEEIAQKNDDLSASIKSTKQNYDNSIESSEANAAAAEYLAGKLQELIAGYDGTAGSAAQIQGVVEQLNEIVPGLGLSWDSVTNSLNLTNAEIYANIEAMKAQAQVAALQDMYTESLKEQYQAQKNLTESAKTLKGVLDAHGLTIQEVNGLIEDGNLTIAEAWGLVIDHGIAIEDLTGFVEELTGAYSEVIQATDNKAEADENVKFAEEELGKAMVTAAEQTEAAKETVLNATDEINNNVNFDPAIESATEAGEAIPQELADNISAGQTEVETAASDLADAVIDNVADVPDDMYTTGDDAGSEMNEGLKSQLDPVKNTIQSMAGYFDSETSQIGHSLYNLAITALSGFATAIVQTTADQVVPAIQDMVSGMASALATLPPSMYDVGYQAGSGLYSGLSAWSDSLYSLAWSIANSINAAARSALRISSPSKVMERIGQYTGEGLELGLERAASGIYQTAYDIASDTATALTPEMEGIKALNTRVNATVSGEAVSTANNLSLSSVLNLLTQYLPYLAKDSTIVLDTGELVGATAPAINNELQRIAVQAARG